MRLENNNCLVIGGGNIAFNKIHQLLVSKAQVIVVAPQIDESIISLPVITYNHSKDSSYLDKIPTEAATISCPIER